MFAQVNVQSSKVRMLGADRGNSQSNEHVPTTGIDPTDVHLKNSA